MRTGQAEVDRELKPRKRKQSSETLAEQLGFNFISDRFQRRKVHGRSLRTQNKKSKAIALDSLVTT